MIMYKGDSMGFKKAFTMAEAILVMTILGIIATIMITNIKPTEFRDKGLSVLAKKVLTQIDAATQQIVLSHTQQGYLSNVYPIGSTSSSAFTALTEDQVQALYKKYLVTTRKTCTNETTDCRCFGKGFVLMLKDGSCMAYKNATAAVDTRFPGEGADVNVTPNMGYIFIDINNTDEPNVMGKDQFVVPLNQEGIHYDAQPTT